MNIWPRISTRPSAPTAQQFRAISTIAETGQDRRQGGRDNPLMSNVVLLFVCLCLGVLLGNRGLLPPATPRVLNSVIVHISLPAVILLRLHGTRLPPELLFPVGMPWISFLLACGFFWLLGRALRLPDTTIGGPMLVGGLANTSFVGLPMIEPSTAAAAWRSES